MEFRHSDVDNKRTYSEKEPPGLFEEGQFWKGRTPKIFWKNTKTYSEKAYSEKEHFFYSEKVYSEKDEIGVIFRKSLFWKRTQKSHSEKTHFRKSIFILSSYSEKNHFLFRKKYPSLVEGSSIEWLEKAETRTKTKYIHW